MVKQNPNPNTLRNPPPPKPASGQPLTRIRPSGSGLDRTNLEVLRPPCTSPRPTPRLPLAAVWHCSRERRIAVLPHRTTLAAPGSGSGPRGQSLPGSRIASHPLRLVPCSARPNFAAGRRRIPLGYSLLVAPRLLAVTRGRHCLRTDLGTFPQLIVSAMVCSIVCSDPFRLYALRDPRIVY